MRSLIVLYYHKLPYPITSGTNKRIEAMVAFLRQRYRVGLVVPAYHPEAEQLAGLFDYIWFGGNYNSVSGKVKWRLQRIVYGFFFHWKLEKKARILKPNRLLKPNVHAGWRLYRVCQKYKPALLMVQKVPNTSPAVQIARHFGIPAVLDAHDLLSLRQAEMPGIAKEESTIAPAELDLFRLYDALIAIQQQEADLLRKYLPAQTVLTALHPVEGLNTPLKKANPSEEISILFVGSASDHNIDALEYFITYQLPQVTAFEAKVRFTVCGGVSDAVKGRITPGGFGQVVEWVGVTEKLDEYYRSASIVINPVRFGSGLKIKTVEALGYGKCVVTTPLGAEGVPEVEDVLVISAPDRMWQAIRELIQNPGQITIYQAKAREYTRKYLTPEACFRELIQWIERSITD